MNTHFRYIVPALPFFFVWVSKVGQILAIRPLVGKWRVLAVTVIVALTWSVTSSLWAYPHSLSYFNELVGGSQNGGKHLLNSNIDWGQDLLYLKHWLNENPNVTLDGMAFFGSYPAALAGVPETPHPPIASSYSNLTTEGSNAIDFCGPKPGWYVLSVNCIYNRRNEYYQYFLHFKPVAMAGYSIYIYHITLDDANRVRRKLELPELDEAETKTLENKDY